MPQDPRLTPEEMKSKIEEFFASPPLKTHTTKDGPIEIPSVTITGLCLHLGFCSRQSFYDYEQRDEYSYIIKRARTMIECEYEHMLKHGNTAGAIFALKQFGWTDKQDLSLGNIDGQPLKTESSIVFNPVGPDA